MKRNLQVANKKDSAQEERYPKIDPKTGINLKIKPLATAIAMIISGVMMPVAYAGVPAGWTQYDGTGATTNQEKLYIGETGATLDNDANIALTANVIVTLTSGISDENSTNNKFNNSGTFAASNANVLTLLSGLANSENNNLVANNNTFTNSGTIANPNGSIWLVGGYASSGNGNTETSNNTINLTGGHISATNAGDAGILIVGGAAEAVQGQKATANGNTVNIATDLTNAVIDGGNAKSTGTAIAENNKIIIDNGTYENMEMHGGYAGGFDEALPQTASASNNTIILGNATFTGTIYGGHAQGNTASASNNTIIIGNGTYSNVEIYGGYAQGATASASNNTIYVHGNADLSQAYLYGGFATGDETLNNTLVFGYNNTAWTPSNYTILEATNFATIRFSNVTWARLLP